MSGARFSEPRSSGSTATPVPPTTPGKNVPIWTRLVRFDHESASRSEHRRAVAVAVRAWARETGQPIADTGALPAAVLHAWAAAGRPVVLAARCCAPGCSRVATATHTPPLCSRCRMRWRRAGVLTAPRGATGAAHRSWKGERVGYWGAHERCDAMHGPASLYVCNGCPARAADWALMPDAAGATRDPLDGRTYSPDPDDYRPLCRPCHATMDAHSRHADDLAAAADTLPGLDAPDLITRPNPPRLPLRPYVGRDS